MILRAHDTKGTGRLRHQEAERVLCEVREYGERQARRNLERGTGLFWDRYGDRIHRHSLRVLTNLDVLLERPAVLIPHAAFAGHASHVHALFTALVHPQERGSWITRAGFRRITGVPKST